MGGPVISDAQAALANGDVTPVLKWIQPEQEAETRAAFAKTMRVRVQGVEARELADRYFFETVVRLHRAAEGEPYSGLKPADAVEPIVAATDEALATGAVEGLVESVNADVARGIRQHFLRVLETKKHAGESVAAGRQYVAAYVALTHYIEELHATAAAAGGKATAAHAE